MNIDERIAELENSINNSTSVEQEQEPNETRRDNAFLPDSFNKDGLISLQNMTYDEAKENIKKSTLVSTGEDEHYVSQLQEQSKGVLTESIALEREKVEMQKLQILLEQEKLATQKEKELNDRLKAKYGANLDKQEYHYKSLQPILETFWIKKPMNVYVMWAIAILGCLTLIYPLKLLFSATFGNLIAGATSESRKGLAKGAMWTTVAILGFAFTAILIFGIVKLGIFLFNQ